MEKLIEVLSIQSGSYDQFRMFAYIIRQVKQIEGASFYVSDGNIYIQRGHSSDYPCMVAHMDTVHDICEDLYPVVVNGNITGLNRVTMTQTGIGGDDKVGVYIALEMLRKFDNIKVAFFRDEEVGCHGSYDADMGFFKDCRFVLQCDRRGNDDFITSASGVELSGKSFQDAVLPIISGFGYKFAHGMMTDVMALKENGIRCSVANIGCGYYNPHCDNEFVNIYDVQNCLEMCETIIRYCTDMYKHKYKSRHGYASYTKPTKAISEYKWYEAGNGAMAWEEDLGWPDYVDKKNGPSYCRDCWSGEPVHDGLCKTCVAWYKDHNDHF